MKLRGLIFDFDGLIVDTESPIYQAWAEDYAAEGLELKVETFVQCVGSDWENYHPGKELERITGKRFDWTTKDQQRRERSNQLLESAGPLPGIVDLLKEAQSEGLPCAIASSSPRDWVGPWLERLELRGYFQEVVTLDDVEKPKPSPQLFERAAMLLDQPKGTLLILEDSVNGLRAAQAAGIACINVPNPITKHLDFTGARRVLSSLERVRLHDLDSKP